MLEKSLLRFTEENFGDKYCASLDGENKKIRPVKRRSMFKGPFLKNELLHVILDGLEKYIDSIKFLFTLMLVTYIRLCLGDKRDSHCRNDFPSK